MTDETLRGPDREREINEALDRSRAPVEDEGLGLTDIGELNPDRAETVMIPVDDEDTDPDTTEAGG